MPFYVSRPGIFPDVGDCENEQGRSRYGQKQIEGDDKEKNIERALAIKIKTSFTPNRIFSAASVCPCIVK
jgi:hypothetical protein